ncbi:transcriptional regulator [Vibrio sp. UCD-FRSSP16_10]|uniref:metalloregulator ArsR/SmtB family transcription factor n=1 Tax=unclassified Vibrio TaxID=2614977 RepID=UPI0007FF9C25|nr:MULTISPECIES: metalloregulator ArsR/SmtB family transcription factor [unclassified Vibrio]OBT10198.1 transcriptional regulator [Vibrio sp. UCD-FRSSP16_30]OBT18988.1 transcriptional regulator [Vibrio sp. UCD-FRSSP16_10]
MLPHQFFKLLADETRLRSLLLIAREGSLCVCELTHALQESQPKVSRHLAQMRRSGILVDERRGQWVYYHVALDLPGWAKKVLDGLRDSNCLKEQYQQDTQRLVHIDAMSCV